MGKSDVLIIEAPVSQLFSHLSEQGRNFGNVTDIEILLYRAIDDAWGTARAVRFNDEQGGGWIIDLSKKFDGEMLYAQIRTLHGRRTLTAVVDVDEYEGFVKNGKWKQNTAINPEAVVVDEDALREANNIEKGTVHKKPSVQPREIVQQKEPDVMLILYIVDGSYCDPIKCSREGVQNKVRELLQDPNITEESIEIWSHMSKPKVTIQF